MVVAAGGAALLDNNVINRLGLYRIISNGIERMSDERREKGHVPFSLSAAAGHVASAQARTHAHARCEK